MVCVAHHVKMICNFHTIPSSVEVTDFRSISCAFVEEKTNEFRCIYEYFLV